MNKENATRLFVLETALRLVVAQIALTNPATREFWERFPDWMEEIIRRGSEGLDDSPEFLAQRVTVARQKATDLISGLVQQGHGPA